MFHSLPALFSPFRYHSSIQEPNPKIIEMLPLTSRGFGWGWMSLEHKVLHYIVFPLLSLVSRQSKDVFPSLLPRAKYLDGFFMNLPLQVYNTAQSENTWRDTIVVTFIVH